MHLRLSHDASYGCADAGGKGQQHKRAARQYKGEPMRAERIMERAGLDSDKPIDVFKVKSRDKGKPGADRPLLAYRELVVTVQRPGLYSMPCSAG